MGWECAGDLERWSSGLKNKFHHCSKDKLFRLSQVLKFLETVPESAAPKTPASKPEILIFCPLSNKGARWIALTLQQNRQTQANKYPNRVGWQRRI